jgi:hypothetical protein
MAGKDATQLAAAKEKLTTLSAGFAGFAATARTEAAHGRILTRLSKLRAHGKVTPAEIKKMDLVKLAASPANEIELVLATFENREPSVLVGQVGSTKASDLSALSDSEKKKAQLEADSRSRMSLLVHADANKAGGAKTVRLEGGRTEGEAEKPGDKKDDKDEMAYFEKEYEEISKMMGEGKSGEAKDRLKAFMTKHKAMSGSALSHTETNAEETEKHLSALADNVSKMQAQFDEVMKVASDLVA